MNEKSLSDVGSSYHIGSSRGTVGILPSASLSESAVDGGES